MKPTTTRTAASLAWAQLALAVPNNITAVPLGPACTSYPGFGEYANDSTGPFVAVADSTGNAVDGVAVGAQYYYYMDGEQQPPWGFVTTPAADASANAAPPATNLTLRCANSTLQAQVTFSEPSAANATTTPPPAPVWTELVVSGDPGYEGGLGFGFPPHARIPVEAYWHFDDAGRQVPGVYLGARGSTAWGFADNWAGVAGEYYLLRLLAGDGAFNSWEMTAGDLTGYLKVTYPL
ncbi:hypothetical protein F4780DRAFT_796404 [Xylariomycetidae sp. FL0641]|nr:hypothetical protein F4780DRAFT_796404 [Xylariomycetidae sp. FL0641]